MRQRLWLNVIRSDNSKLNGQNLGIEAYIDKDDLPSRHSTKQNKRIHVLKNHLASLHEAQCSSQMGTWKRMSMYNRNEQNGAKIAIHLENDVIWLHVRREATSQWRQRAGVWYHAIYHTSYHLSRPLSGPGRSGASPSARTQQRHVTWRHQLPTSTTNSRTNGNNSKTWSKQ